MAKAATVVTREQVHPFRRVFPRLYLAVAFVAACVRLVVAAVRVAWRYRVELAATVVAMYAWQLAIGVVGDPVLALEVLAVVGLATAGLLAVPPAPAWLRKRLSARWWSAWPLGLFGVRQRGSAFLTRTTVTVRVRQTVLRLRPGLAVLWAAGCLVRARTRRRMLTGLQELRLANTSGRLPRVRWVRSTAVGERVALACRPGQSAELLEVRAEELRAAARSRDVRIHRNPNRSHLVYVDVVRRDPLANTSDVAWLDAGRDAVSIWDSVHWGTDETGAPVYLPLPYRQVLMGGGMDSGKSGGLNLLISHAAKSVDCHLLLIDPNRVQFSPWQDRALAFATKNPDDAIDLLKLIDAEMDRRQDLLDSLPGVNRKITREIAEQHNVPAWLLAIDELAYHTSVVGTPAQRAEFNTRSRDVVSRSRAFLIIPIVATQRPTSDVVPTSLRDLFAIRVAYRCSTGTSSDVILGDNYSRQGYSATDIDLSNPGLNWLKFPGQPPMRTKTAWTADDLIADLAATTIRHRPDVPDWITTRPESAPSVPGPSSRLRQRRRPDQAA